MRFCKILSLILVLVKIFSLITISWWLCLTPFLIALVIKAIVWLVIIIASIVILAKDDT